MTTFIDVKSPTLLTRGVALSVGILMLLLIGLINPATASAAGGCVSQQELKRVKVGMSLSKAKKLLRGQPVNWDTTTPSYQDAWHWPKQCKSTTAMLIVSRGSTVTFMVNKAERPAKNCTTFKTMKRIKKGMWESTVKRILGSSRVERSSTIDGKIWFPRPCQHWAHQEIQFRKNRVVYVGSFFYYG